MSRPSDVVPVKPSRLRVDLEETGTSLTVNYRHREWGGGCFLMLWLCGWTVGCVFLAAQIWNKPELFMVAFAIPFWASWFFVFFLLLSMFLQHEELMLSADDLTYSKRIVVPIKTRVIPLAELLRFEDSRTTNFTENDQPKSYLEMVTVGRPLLALAGLSVDERTWLTWRLNQHLAFLKPENLRRESPEPSLRESSEPPSDCSWRCDDSFEGTTFTQRGRAMPAQLFGLLFVNLFWNGIVSVFVMTLIGVAPGGPEIGPEWWGMFLFLIPFEVIGLLMFGALLYVLLEPARRTLWRFERDEVAFRRSWLGLVHTRRYDATSIERMQLDIGEGGAAPTGRSLVPTLQTTASRHIRLRLIDTHNTEVVSITGLTEGEARWMIDCVRRDHPDWFR